LGYEGAEEPSPTDPVCFGCGKPLTTLSKCAKCKVAAYCERDCQVKDWKASHKAACASYQRVGANMKGLVTPESQAQARQEIFHRVRFYACAYAIHKEAQVGKGFLFLQSNHSLAAMSVAIPKDSYGRKLGTRGIMVHYLTLGEFSSELCRDDFEMTTFKSDLTTAVENYDPQTQVILLLRFRCGHVAIGRAQLSMSYASFKTLGKQFFAEQNAECLQLNIDDV
jgi:hypothetical protein